MVSQIEEVKNHLGICSNTEKETVLEITKREFSKWNGRVTVLQGKEKNNIVSYLNVIAKIKKEFS